MTNMDIRKLSINQSFKRTGKQLKERKYITTPKPNRKSLVKGTNCTKGLKGIITTNIQDRKKTVDHAKIFLKRKLTQNMPAHCKW